MKQFACGDVVPGCDATFEGADNDEILRQVAAHAAEFHDLQTVPDSLVADVVSKIQDAES